MKLASFLTFAIVLSVITTGSLAAQSAPAAATKGKAKWIKENCYSCHGYDGHGGAGAKLAPKPISMIAFIAFVRHPPASTMPTFSAKIIPDADLRDMWTYLNSIPSPPAVKDIPLLNP